MAAISSCSSGSFEINIRDACRRAEHMMVTAVMGSDQEFHLAVQDAIVKLEKLTRS